MTLLGSAPVAATEASFDGVVLAEGRVWAIVPHSVVLLEKDLAGLFRQTQKVLMVLSKDLLLESVPTAIVGVLHAPHGVDQTSAFLGRLESIFGNPKPHSARRFECSASVFAYP